MYILSFDIASKSLAVSFILFDCNYMEKMHKCINEISKLHQKIKHIDCNTPIEYIYTILNDIKQQLFNYTSIINNIIKPIFLDVVDLIPEKKIKDMTVITRANRLKSYINYIDKLVYSEIKKDNNNLLNTVNIKVLLEYQMGPNDKSRNVCSQILYNYSNIDDHDFKSCNFTQLTSQYDKTPKTIKDISYSVDIVGPSLKNKIDLDKTMDYCFFLNKYKNKYNANKKHSSYNFLLWMERHSFKYMVENIPKKNIDDIADAFIMTLAWIKYIM